jgi:hypothetical protein
MLLLIQNKKMLPLKSKIDVSPRAYTFYNVTTRATNSARTLQRLTQKADARRMLRFQHVKSRLFIPNELQYEMTKSSCYCFEINI